MFINVEKPPVKVDTGIKTPPKMLVREIKMEDIGPVCFSFEHTTPTKIPAMT